MKVNVMDVMSVPQLHGTARIDLSPAAPIRLRDSYSVASVGTGAVSWGEKWLVFLADCSFIF
jgi:hypothetical protein